MSCVLVYERMWFYRILQYSIYFSFFLKATLKTNCNYIQSWLTQLTVSKYISRGLWGLFVFWAFVVGRFFGFCFGGGFLPNLCHMHVILCYECQTRLSIEECRCLYGTLLGKITVILSLDLEKTSLSYSWKSAQTFRTELVPYLYPNFKARPPPKQTEWLDASWQWVSLKPPSIAFLSISLLFVVS